jgi:hypothetical protein
LTAWSTKRYLNIELLKDQQMRGAITVSQGRAPLSQTESAKDSGHYHPFCQGERNEVGRSRMPIARARALNAAPHRHDANPLAKKSNQ